MVNGAAGHPHAAVTNVPKGTGNDFLKMFGPDYRTLFYDLEALAVGPQTPFDLIDCNGRLGIDVVCAGVDARIAADVHRYKDWSKELKLMYDYHPELQVVFTGSSVLDINKGVADLSRRAVMYHMQGLSFREYLLFSTM